MALNGPACRAVTTCCHMTACARAAVQCAKTLPRRRCVGRNLRPCRVNCRCRAVCGPRRDCQARCRRALQPKAVCRCTREYVPVCTKDGTVYFNRCLAEVRRRCFLDGPCSGHPCFTAARLVHAIISHSQCARAEVIFECSSLSPTVDTKGCSNACEQPAVEPVGAPLPAA